MPSARKYVNRRAHDYHIRRIGALTQLDKVASYLLALNYSNRASPKKVSQGLIQMDCVAVAVINDEWLIASNSRKLDDNDIILLSEELGIDMTYALISRGDGQMHAEMQVLEEISASNYSAANVQFGVSKPCCKKCAEWLSHYGAKYSAWHDAQVVNWEKPDMS